MKTLTSISILFLLTISVSAQTAPDAAELTKLLNDFLAGASRNDVAVHERFWADDLIYTRSAGRRVNKAEVMHDVRTAPAPKPTEPKTIYTAQDIRIQQYGNTAVVAFRLVATTEKNVANLLNSGTFVKRNGKWQVVNWQSTRMPRAEAESKSEVTTASTALHDAIASGDVDKLKALTDQTFVWTHGAAQTTREQLIGGQKVKYEKPDAAKVSIAVYGDTAVVRGESYTLVFINQLGVWRAVSLHTSS
jgi:hypothetical protein